MNRFRKYWRLLNLFRVIRDLTKHPEKIKQKKALITLTLGICAALTYILDPDIVRQIQDFLLSIINGM